MEKNLEKREGFINRNIHGMPEEPSIIKVVRDDVDGEHEYICQWKPFNPEDYTKKEPNYGMTQSSNMPGEGYIGTASVIDGKYSGIGFHIWRQNNSEFVYYSLIK